MVKDFKYFYNKVVINYKRDALSPEYKVFSGYVYTIGKSNFVLRHFKTHATIEPIKVKNNVTELVPMLSSKETIKIYNFIHSEFYRRADVVTQVKNYMLTHNGIDKLDAKRIGGELYIRKGNDVTKHDIDIEVTALLLKQ